MRIKAVVTVCIGVMLFMNAALFAESADYEFCIIKGDKVNLRSEPVVTSKVVKQFRPGELVFYLDKTDKRLKVGEDEDFWYKVKTQENKYGWVFGKYIYYIDGSKYPERFFREILIYEIVKNDKLSAHSTNYNITFKEEKEHKYIIFSYDHIDNDPVAPILLGWTLFFQIENNTIKLATYGDGDEYWFIGKYILTRHQWGIRVYDSSKFVKGPYYPAKQDMVYANVYKLHVRDKINEAAGESLGKSTIEFDEKERIATLHIRDEKGAPLRIEKYKFKDGKFLKID